MRPTEPLDRLLAWTRQLLRPGGTGAPGERVRALPWDEAPPANPARIARAFHETGIPVLGHVVPPGDRCRFDRDPATGERWSNTDPMGDVNGQGLDPRTIWELGRLQHLALLAAACPEDPTPLHDARAFRRHHPVGHGLPWASTLEVALRLVALAQIISARPVPDLRLAVAEHAQWLLRWPSVGSSARNHRVAELAALAVAAWMLPDAVDQPQWSEEAAQLPSALDEQVHPDGVGVEQSTHYLAFVLEWGLVARSVGIEGLDEPMRRAVRFLTRLVAPSGAAVRIGDDDDGRVITCHLGPERTYVTSVVGAASLVLGEVPPEGWQPDRRSGLLAPEPPSGRLTPTSGWFPNGGLLVLRAPGRVVVMDHGPLGEPDLAAHGHADALGLWIELDDGPVLVGRGTGTYNGNPALRRFHRSSVAQPTVVIDGLSQSQPHEHPFLWRTRAHCRVHEMDLADGMLVASHDGYAERLGIVHRRRIEHTASELVIEDALLGRGTHHVAIQFPLAPGLRVVATEHELTVRNAARALLEVRPDPRCSVRIRRRGRQALHGAAQPVLRHVGARANPGPRAPQPAADRAVHGHPFLPGRQPRDQSIISARRTPQCPPTSLDACSSVEAAPPSRDAR